MVTNNINNSSSNHTHHMNNKTLNIRQTSLRQLRRGLSQSTSASFIHIGCNMTILGEILVTAQVQ